MNSKSNNSTSLLPKLVGETKHYPPAVKEWNNSVYTYNKYLLKSLPSKDIMAKKIIKGYFNLSDSKHLARSKRMRTFIRKLSENKLFVAQPEFKQTNDNVAITIYTLDIERQLLLRKIYHDIRKQENTRNKYNSYDYWRNKYCLNKSLKELENSALIPFTKNKLINTKPNIFKNNNLVSLYLKTKHLSYINRTHYLKTRSNLYTYTEARKKFSKKINMKNKVTNKNIPYFGGKLLNEAKFLRYTSQFKNNSIQARKRVYYSYIKSIFSLLGIKVLSFDKIDSNMYKENNKNFISNIENFTNLRYKGKILLFFNSKEKHLNELEILDVNSIQQNLPYIDKVNIVLSSVVNKILNNNNLVKSENLSLANFSKINFEKFLLREYTQGSLSKNNRSKVKLDISTIKKEISLMKDYINLKINNFKFGKYLPALKLLISKIYNKNAQLNIIKLKYLYLNSDIFIQAILLKLKGKINHTNAMDQSIELIKIHNEFNDVPNEVNNMHKLNVYNSLKLKGLFASNVKTNNIDNLELVLKNIYPVSLINQQKNNSDITQKKSKNTETISSKLTEIIKTVKYKWVTGVRLEMTGRLTRRYSASRSVYKYVHKGSLKNTDFSKKLDFLKKSMPVIMFRNIAKPNTQYTFTKSKKRIGAFGLKGWISSY